MAPHIDGAFLPRGQKEAALLCLCEMKQPGTVIALLVPTENTKRDKGPFRSKPATSKYNLSVRILFIPIGLM